MTTSKQWWESVKNDPTKFNEWLQKQYRGEITAASRIEQFAEKYATQNYKRTLRVIAKQERQHASWVLELLINRGITPDVANAENRYWSETLPEIESFETGAAIGAHAEAMRLERIRVISADDSAPSDVQEIFKKILKDELFHERAFRVMAGDQAMQKTMASHEAGRKLLGLET